MKYTIENIVEGINKFNNEYKRYPTVVDFDSCTYLPTAKTIQRRFGGISEIRKYMQLPVVDFRSNFTERMKSNKKYITSIKNSFYTEAISYFGVNNVHSRFCFVDDTRESIDFTIFDESKKTCIGLQFINPSNYRTLGLCLNLKKQKVELLNEVIGYTVKFYFVIANDNFKKEELDSITKFNVITLNELNTKIKNSDFF